MIKISYCFLIEPDGGKHHEKSKRAERKLSYKLIYILKQHHYKKMLSQIEVDTKGRQERKKRQKKERRLHFNVMQNILEKVGKNSTHISLKEIQNLESIIRDYNTKKWGKKIYIGLWNPRIK